MDDYHPIVVSGQIVTVVIADDHPVYRQGLAAILGRREDIRLVGEASNGRDAVELTSEVQPDVLLLDLNMPDIDGLGVLRGVARAGSGTRVVMLSAAFDSATVYAALGSGATGFLTKDTSGEAICEGVRAAARGETVLSPDVQSALAHEVRKRAVAESSPLTARELEILGLTANGHSAPAIAAQLFLSPATVKTHLQKVYEKLGVSDRAAAVAEAMRRGLVD